MDAVVKGQIVYVVDCVLSERPQVHRAEVEKVTAKTIFLSEVGNPGVRPGLAFNCRRNFSPQSVGVEIHLTSGSAVASWKKNLRGAVDRLMADVERLRKLIAIPSDSITLAEGPSEDPVSEAYTEALEDRLGEVD